MKSNKTQSILVIIFCFTGILLLISTFASFFNPADFPFFSFIGLFFPLLWIINALFLLLLLVIKSRLAFVSLILLLSGIYQVSLVYNISNGQDPKLPAKEINLVTFNTGNADTIDTFNKRKYLFKDEVFTKSDIICLQESIPEDENGINVLANFKNNINVDYYGIAGGDSSGLSVYTNYEIVDFGWMKQEMEDTYALWCDLNIARDTIKLINVQLQSIRLEEDELESMTTANNIIYLPNKMISIYSKLKRGFVWREGQVQELEKLISLSDYPVILCGDFNDPPSSFTYRQLSKLLNDAFIEKGSGFGFTYAGKLSFLRIDYVMVGEGLGVSSYQKMDSTFSDHYPVNVVVSCE